MATTTPPAITALPAAPDPNNRSTFNTLAYPWSAALPTFGTQVSAVAANVKANADEVITATDAVMAAGLSTAAANAATASAAAGTATTQAGIATNKAIEANASAVAAAASVSSIAGGPVASVNGMTGVVTGLASIGANTFNGAQNLPTGADIASAATVNLDTATGNRVHITGTTAITAVTLTRGPRTVIFDGVLTLTHHATNNNLPGAANITTAAGDRAIYESDGSTVYCVSYIKVSGSALVAPSTEPGVFYVRDEKTSGTAGGLATNGTFVVRDLNTVVVSGIAGASLSANAVTLPAGVYEFRASCPAYGVGRHKIELRNVSDATSIYGTSETAPGSTQNRSFVNGKITLLGSKTFSIRHRAESSTGGNDFGVPVSASVIEVYSELLFRKVA